MRITVIGSGAAAGAVVHRLEAETGADRLWLIDWDQVLEPGGSEVAFWHERIAEAAQEEGTDLVVVLDQQPLADGIADVLTEAGLPCVGPIRAAAATMQTPAATRSLLAATGLRTPTRPAGPAGDPGAGEEDGAYLVWAFCDGASARLWPAVRRYPRARDGGRGPATEGMGAATLPEEATDRAFDQYAVHAVLDALRERGIDYRGLLTVTVRATAAGPAVVDLGTQWGDPETQALLAVLDGPLLPLLSETAAGGHLTQNQIPVTGDQSVQITLADPDYPNPPQQWTTATLPPGAAMSFEDGPRETRPARRRATIGGTGTTAEAARLAAYGNLAVFAEQFGCGLPFHYRRDIGADIAEIHWKGTGHAMEPPTRSATCLERPDKPYFKEV